MTDERSDLKNLPRVLGSYPEGREVLPGERLLVLVGGLHGNEPAGVRAILKFFEELKQENLALHGHVIGLAGNRPALEEGERYIDCDLNRLWSEDFVAFDRSRTEVPSAVSEIPRAAELAEFYEQQEILEELQKALSRKPSQAILLDLHSTSADGSPFAIMADTLQNRPLAMSLGIPVLLGLEERVEGTLLSWFSEMGHSALCVEGGQNGLDSTLEHHLAVIWITLVTAGLVEAENVPRFETHLETLSSTAWGLPDLCEIRYRYEVPVDTDFRMEPGFTNFHIVSRGTHLANLTRDGKTTRIHCPHDGQLIMPRYQGQGNDGFFLGTEIPSWALRLSAFLRHLRLGKLVRLLPGVKSDPKRQRGLIVDKKIARWKTAEILHLFGYRRRARQGDKLYFLRRPDRFEEAAS